VNFFQIFVTFYPIFSIKQKFPFYPIFRFQEFGVFFLFFHFFLNLQWKMKFLYCTQVWLFKILINLPIIKFFFGEKLSSFMLGFFPESWLIFFPPILFTFLVSSICQICPILCQGLQKIVESYKNPISILRVWWKFPTFV
jgi:hypothetical protein